ncbi:unnamed protein product [Effrenium voratum]|nr:unnamed protein product [Effrenium voratum]
MTQEEFAEWQESQQLDNGMCDALRRSLAGRSQLTNFRQLALLCGDHMLGPERQCGDDELTVVIRPYIDEGGELQAAYDGGLGVVRLERPVDPDAEVTGTPMVDAGGETALHWAAMRCEDLVSCRRGRSRRRGGPRNRARPRGDRAVLAEGWR